MVFPRNFFTFSFLLASKDIIKIAVLGKNYFVYSFIMLAHITEICQINDCFALQCLDLNGLKYRQDDDLPCRPCRSAGHEDNFFNLAFRQGTAT
jgi:hypothetical protein